MITLAPTGGRDYKSQEAVKRDFDRNWDFIIYDFSNKFDGKRVNKQQLAGSQVKIRYNNMRRVVVIDVPEE